jgi:hypothetical protein
MGRHSSDVGAGGKGGTGIAIFSVIAVVALVLVGFGVRALVVSDPSSAQDEGGSSQGSEEAGSGGETNEGQEQPDMDDGGTAEGADEAGSEQAEATEQADTEQEVEADDAPQALAQCHARVAAGNEWAAATAVSAGHWKQHYSASVRYNAGEISLKQAEKEFAESKAQGANDMAAVSAAQKRYEEHQGACDGLAAEELPQGWSEQAEQCLARADAIDEVVATGTEVNGDWSEHLDMMRHKKNIDPQVYYERWRAMVEAAPTAMDPYEAAAADLQDAPSCSV